MKVSIGKWKTHTHTCPLPHTKARLCQGASEADTHWGPASPSLSRKAAFLVFHKGERLWQRGEQVSRTADLIHPQTDTMWRGKLQEMGRLCPRKDFLQAVNRKPTWKAVLKIHRRLETSSRAWHFKKRLRKSPGFPALSCHEVNLTWPTHLEEADCPPSQCGLNFTRGFIHPWCVLGYLWESLQPREKIKSLSSHTYFNSHEERHEPEEQTLPVPPECGLWISEPHLWSS